MSRSRRFVSMLATAALVATSMYAQEPGLAGGGGWFPPPHPPRGYGPPRGGPPKNPGSPIPPSTPVITPVVCSYSVLPMPAPLIMDQKTSGDDFCNASASGAIAVGEADVDRNSLASSASSTIGWVLTHHAIAGPNPCAPVSFADGAAVRVRVESRLTGGSGSRAAAAAVGTAIKSSVMTDAARALAGTAVNDAGIPATWSFAVPVSSGSASLVFTVANPPGMTTDAKDRSDAQGGAALTEVNRVYGSCFADVSAGSTGFGGGKARIAHTVVAYLSTSVCPTHGVALSFPGYSAAWFSSMPGL
jgi:hypothetical protein